MTPGKEANRILAQYRRDDEKRYRNKLKKAKKIVPEYFRLEEQRRRAGLEFIKKGMAGEATEEIMEKIEAIEDRQKEVLAEHGLDKKDLEKDYHCEKCKDEGHIGGKICSCKRRIEQRLLYRQSDLDERLERENFSTFRLDLFSDEGNPSPKEVMTRIYEKLTAYTENFHEHSPSMLFTGPVGTGKTFLCSAVAKEVIDKGYTVLYRTASDLMKVLWDYYYASFDDRDEAERAFDMIRDADLLIIDDLGTENITDTSVSHLFNLLNDRLVHRRPTIISTNIPVGELNDVYDERIYSRIIGEYEIYVFIGEDLRKVKRGLI